MLGKLMKYELKAFGRVMIPLYGALIAATFVFGLTIRLSMNATAKTIFDRFAIVGGFLFVGVLVAIMVMMVVLIVQRFYNNLLGPEGYLMFTLPATTLEHILSKALSAIIWLILGMITGIISGFLMISLTGNLTEFFREIQAGLRTLHADNNLTLNLFLIALLVLIGIVSSICKVYAALSIGHQWSGHRVFGAVLAFIGIGIVEVGITALLSKLGIYDPGQAAQSFRTFIAYGIVTSLIQILVYGGVSWVLLDRRLNLE